MRLTSLGAIAALAFSLAACDRGPRTSDPSASSWGAPKRTSAAELPKDVEGRLTRLEKRLDKVISVLEQALGPSQPDPQAVYSVPVDPLDPVEGPADAKVTIVEGFEFACPYCQQANPIMEQLLAEYPKDVRVVSKYLVVHEPARVAGLASCAANKQGKYPDMKRMLWTKIWGPDGMGNQGRPYMEQLAPEAMEANAKELGLDVEKFKNDMQGEECNTWIARSEQTLKAVGQTGTPGFYVNGRAFGGLVPLDAMKQVIGQELQKAEASGIPAADYYKVAVVDRGEKKVRGWFEVD